MFKKSNNPQIESLTKSYRDRAYNLSSIRLPEGLKKCCVWCLEPLTGMQRRWCMDDECIKAALAWARPQTEHGLYFLLKKQDFKCNHCSVSFKQYFDEAFPKRVGFVPYSNEIHTYMRKFRGLVPYEIRPEVDHILAISLGGVALGLDNHQVLCMKCHKAKTKIDAGERARTGMLKGREFSETHKEAMSESRRGKDTTARRDSREANLYPKLRIPIVAKNIETGEELRFGSLREAAQQLGLGEANVSKVLRGKDGRTQHKGWTFRYGEQS